MPRKKKRNEFDIYAEEYGDEELEELMELREDFPELGEYLDDLNELEDGDFYTDEH